MLKKFFIVMGVLFTGLIGSCMLVLGGVGIDAAGEAPQNKAVAAVVARDLARAWDVNDLKPHFVSNALSQVNFGQAQLSINPLKPLGALRNIEEAQQTEFRYDKKLGGVTTKTATIFMVAEFENGRANVTIRLMNEGNLMKLLHVNVAPIGNVRAKKEQA
jgi:hypothetical protein